MPRLVSPDPEPISVGELATFLGGRLIAGDPQRLIHRIAPTDRAGPGDVTFVTNRRYLGALIDSGAEAVILGDEADVPSPPTMAVIVVDAPYVAFARTAQRLSPGPPRPAPGLHPTAVVDPTALLGRDVAAGPHVYIGPRAQVGDRVVLHAGVHLEVDCKVGNDTVLYNRVVVRHGCRMGARCIVHPGAVIGADGFGFARATEGPVKIPQMGRVTIEDDVEIGANATIDRGTFDDTFVGRGAKIDNLVQVGHNVRIGPGCILVAQSGVAGSSELEAKAVLGAQSGVSGHLTVGAGATVYGQAGVMKDVPAGASVAGSPAEPRTAFFRSILLIRKLDGWGERVRELERAVRALKDRL